MIPIAAPPEPAASPSAGGPSPGPALRPDWPTCGLALLLAAVIAAGAAISTLVRYDVMGVGHLPRIVLFPTLLLVLTNAGARLLGQRRWFDRRRLMYVYAALLAMANIPGVELVIRQYLIMIAAQGYATPENRVAEVVLPHVPSWMVPGVDPAAPAVRYAFEGVPAGRAVPWRAWVRPLAAWTPVFVALLVLQMALPVLLRRRWVDRERLLFPLARIPVELTRYESDRSALPAVMRQRAFWAAFAVPVVVFTLNGCQQYWPVLPHLRLMRDTGYVFAGRPWTVLNQWPYNLYFEMVGVTYLVPDDMGFSLWSFWVLRKLIMVAREAFGRFDHDPVLREQSFGGYLFLAAAYVYLARAELAAVWRKAVFADRTVDDRGEPLPYRLAAASVVLSLATLVLWCRVAGAAVGPTVLGLLLYVVMILVITRLVAEGGLFIVWPPMERFNQYLVRAFGPHAMGASTVVILSYMGLKLADNSTSTMANALDGYRVGGLAGLDLRWTAGLMLAAMVVATFASHPTALYAIYSRSVPALGWFPRIAFVWFGGDIVRQLTTPDLFRPGDHVAMATGAGVTAGLQALRQRFVWCPLHPLAYVAMTGAPYLGDRYGFSIFLGWLARRAVLSCGGQRSYHAFRVAALGLIAGQAFILPTWSIIHYFHPIEQALIIE